MNTKLIDAIAKTVLYEGYMLYPYRPSSVKNRQRFNFGVLYPRSYSEAQSGSDAWQMQTECLLRGNPQTAVEIRVRFLKLMLRSRREDQAPGPVPFAISESGSQAAPWQEAIECEVKVPSCTIETLLTRPFQWNCAFPEQAEPARGAREEVAATFISSQLLEGIVEIGADSVSGGVFKLQVRVKNLTSTADCEVQIGRDQALMRSLVSAHTLLGVVQGEFISLLEPPEDLREAAASCCNVGAWPVLAGTEGERDTMLASPIILYDYPQIAPESPGDLFDGTEIDEILALRIMTMTDDEKSEMRQGDDRARRILERTESLPMEQLMKLHGTLRELRPSREEMP